jgi:hypothetical protein
MLVTNLFGLISRQVNGFAISHFFLKHYEFYIQRNKNIRQ